MAPVHITGHPLEPRNYTQRPLTELKDYLSATSGFADPMFCSSVVITLGEQGAEIAKATEDFHTMATLSAIQGTYWLVASHCGSPAFKQEPGKPPADQELLLCFLPLDGVHGWYVLSDYPVNRADTVARWRPTSQG